MDNLTKNHGQQLAQDGPLRYLDPWDCETLLNTFTGKENADFENAQFMVNILNLWWTCSIYDEHAECLVNLW